MGDFTMPSLGADMEAGTLIEWMIKPGDQVKRGDIVAVVLTQKGAIEVEVFEDGRVDALLVKPGTKVPVGTVLARIEGGLVTAPTAGPAPPAPAPPRAMTPPAETPPTPPTPLAPARAEHHVRVSPVARALARDLRVALETVHGTGPAGAITRADVERAAQTPAPVAEGPGPRSGMRQAIAAAMSRSKREIPHYYLSTRVDLARALDWLGRQNESRKPADRILPLALFLKAVALAVKKVPEVNGFYEQGAFRPSQRVHVGIAISLREGGLVVPAILDVETKPVDLLGRELSSLVERARRGQLRSSEIGSGTITLTSLGERGVEDVFGIIFPPQVAIVGFGRIVDTPWVVEGGCVPRPTTSATLAADHRVSDGHRGGLFLSQVASLLQNPEAL